MSVSAFDCAMLWRGHLALPPRPDSSGRMLGTGYTGEIDFTLSVAHGLPCWSELQLAPEESRAEAHGGVLKHAP